MKIYPLFVLFILLLSVVPASALQYPLTTAISVHTGHGYGGTSEYPDELDFIVCYDRGTQTTGGRYVLGLFDSLSGNDVPLIQAHSSGILQSGYVATDGHLYYIVTISGVTYLVKSKLTHSTPMWYNGEPILEGQTAPVNPTGYFNNNPQTGTVAVITTISSYVSPTIREYDGNIFYADGTNIKFFAMNELLTSTAAAIDAPSSTKFLDFDILGGHFYKLFGFTTGRPKILVYNDSTLVVNVDPYTSYGTHTISYNHGGVQVIDADNIYVYGQSYTKPASGTGQSISVCGLFNSTGVQITSISGPTGYANTINPKYTFMAISYVEDAMLYLDNGGAAVTLSGIQNRKIYPSSSVIGGGSSGSSSINPLLDLDGDGEFTQDDAKDMAVTLGPATWIFMFMIFLMVAMSAGGRRR